MSPEWDVCTCMHIYFKGNVFALIRSLYCTLIRLRLVGDLSEVVNLQPLCAWHTIPLGPTDKGWVGGEVTMVTGKLKLGVIILLCSYIQRKIRTFYQYATFTFRNSDDKSPWVTSSIMFVYFLLAVFKDGTWSQSSKCFLLSTFQSLIWNALYKLFQTLTIPGLFNGEVSEFFLSYLSEHNNKKKIYMNSGPGNVFESHSLQWRW